MCVFCEESSATEHSICGFKLDYVGIRPFKLQINEIFDLPIVFSVCIRCANMLYAALGNAHMNVAVKCAN